MGNFSGIITTDKNEYDSEIIRKYNVKKRAVDPRY